MTNRCNRTVLTGSTHAGHPIALRHATAAIAALASGEYHWCMKGSMLAGPPGHPFHAFVVPLPVGAFVCSFIFDILTRLRADGLPYLVDAAFWLIGVGLIGALIAAPFGVIDLLAIQRRTAAFSIAVRHLVLNVAAAALFLAGYIWRAGDHVELDKTRWGQLAWSGIAVVLLAAAVWLGNTLTYRHGSRVRNAADTDDTPAR